MKNHANRSNFGHSLRTHVQPANFRTATKEINAMSPDAVIITGDLTEDGIQSQFKQAAKEEWVNKRYSYKLI